MSEIGEREGGMEGGREGEREEPYYISSSCLHFLDS